MILVWEEALWTTVGGKKFPPFFVLPGMGWANGIDKWVCERYTKENKSAKADTKGEMNYEFIK